MFEIFANTARVATRLDGGITTQSHAKDMPARRWRWFNRLMRGM